MRVPQDALDIVVKRLHLVVATFVLNVFSLAHRVLNNIGKNRYRKTPQQYSDHYFPCQENTFLYPRYKVYWGYIVFAFSVIMFVCLSVCLFVNFFSVKDFSATTWVRILKFGTKLDGDELYCVTKEQPHIAYRSLYLFIFLSLKWKFLSQISQFLLEPVFSNFVLRSI